MTTSRSGLTLNQGTSRFNTVRHTLGITFIGRQFDNLVRHLSDIPLNHRYWNWARFGALMSAAIGFVGLIGWLRNIPILAQGYQGSVLIAPRAAVLFVSIGAALFYFLKNPSGTLAKYILVLAGALTTGLSLLNQRTLLFITPLLEPMLLRNMNVWEYIYRDRMPPLDVYTFLVLGPIMLFLPFVRRLPKFMGDFAGTAFLFAMVTHAIILQGYLYGFPFLYPQGFKPTSLPGAVGFCVLSASFILALGTYYFPLRPLAGPTVRARLFRTFLPVGIASIVIYSLLLQTVFRFLNPALTSSCSAFVAAIVVCILVARSSRLVSSQVERAVRETEKQFGVMVETVKDYSIFMMNPEGYVVTWNGGAERVKGYRAEEVIGEHFSIFYSSEDRAIGKPAKALQKAREQGSYKDEGWRLRKDGSHFWAEIVLTAIHDESNRLLGFSKVERDITERRTAEENLRRKTSFIQLLQAVSSASNNASTLEEAMGICLEQVCQKSRWSIGHGLRLLEDRQELVSVNWYLEPNARLKTFIEKTDARIFQKGIDLPGRVLATGKPAWITDIGRDHHFPRKEAAKAAGLKAGCAFPILSGTEVIGVLEFFDEKAVEPDVDLLEVMVQVGTQLGRVAERQKSEAHMSASLSEKEVLLREIHHRVKNNLQIISSLLHLQSEHVAEPGAASMFQESQDRVRSMSLIHEYLYQSADLAHLQFSEYIRSLVTNLQTSYGVEPGTLKVTLEIEPLRLDLDTAIPCGLIVTELVSNALKHAFPVKDKTRDEIFISFREQSNTYQLRVKDNGVGLPADLEIDTTRSLGLRLVRALTHQLGGELHIERSGGTEYRIVFAES